MTRSAFFAAALLLAFSPPVTAQEDSLPGVFVALAGEWEGSGLLFGNPAAFRMSWTPLAGGFVRLSFTNLMLGENGDSIPVLHAEATYRVDGTTALGVWIDDRPQQLTLSANLTDSSVVTEWVAPAERGRTEYVVTAEGGVVVRDYVIGDSGPRLFAESTYVRTDAAGR